MAGRLLRLIPANAVSFLFAAIIATGIGSLEATAETASPGKAAIQKVVSLFSVWHGNDASSGVFKEVAKVIDYEEMSEKALGAHWNNLKPVERSEFVSTFQSLIEERYYKRWHKIFNSAELAYKSEVPVEGDLYIKTLMTVGKKQDSVVWRLSNRSGQYKIINITVNKKDLLARLTARLDQRLRKDSFKGVLSWMREEAADDDDDDDRRVKSHSLKKVLIGGDPKIVKKD